MILQGFALGPMIHQGTETCVRYAVHEPTATRVIVKMPLSGAPPPHVLGRLQCEHQVLEALRSVPGVVREHSFVQQTETAALVLHDDACHSLSHLLAKEGRLPLPIALRLGRNLARILAAVHAAGVIHKDINPQNLLTDETGEQVVLIDFSISTRRLHEATSADMPEALEGTLPYLSPEQTGRTARALDSRTDLYSLGITLYEVLAGRRPFLDRDPLSLVHAHLAKEPPALDQLNPEVPQGVVAIIARLMAKDPEQRYQTARGAAEDLDHALNALQERGTVDSFPLGTKDFSPRLSLPSTLVGRQEEVELVGRTFAHAQRAEARLMLVSGPSGIGKTALVRTVYRDLAAAGNGLLLTGKHDQLARSTPFAGLAQAFGGLVRQWLSRPESVVHQLRGYLREAVGDNIRLIADVVPELELLMGPISPVQQVFGDLIERRLLLTWLSFVNAVIRHNAPLVIFLDDLQWADGATLSVLQALLTDVERKSLLLIGALRDNETPPEHPLWRMVEAVEKSGTEVTRTTLGPLSEPQALQWAARALECDPGRVEPLARQLWQRTRGNPFFLEQLLLSLHRQGHVIRNLQTGQWHWDQAALETMGVTDNVVALLSEKVREMPEQTQYMLGLAACAGHTFRLDDLVHLSGGERARIVSALLPAIREELVVPTSGACRIAEAWPDAAEGVVNAEYRFLHDRVQVACYERISPERRAQTHLDIGRRLWQLHRQQTDRAGSGQLLLELVRHLGLGAEQIETTEERTDVARLHLTAARVAKQASSHRLMANLLETAQSLLGPQGLVQEPALAVELALERIDAAFLLREFDDAEARASRLLALPLPTIPRLAAMELRARCCAATGQYARGAQMARAALAEQGITFPETDAECVAILVKELGALDQWLDQHPDAVDAMPLDMSLEHLLVDSLLAQMLICLGVSGQTPLIPLGLAYCVRQTVERNALTIVAPFFIANFAHIFSAVTGQYRRAARWIEPAVNAASRVPCPLAGECLSYRAIYATYSRPIDESAPLHEKAVTTAVELGSSQGTSWGLLNELFPFRVFRGQPLPQIDAHRKARWLLMKRAGDAHGVHYFELTAGYCQLLERAAHAPQLLDEEPLVRGSHSFMADADGIVAEQARIVEAHLFLVTGRFARALERAREAEQHRPNILGIPSVTNIPLWLALAAAKCWQDTTNSEERALLDEHIKNGIARFEYFADGCPENFLHGLRLIEAERARVQGRSEEAMTRYEEAILAARQQRFLHLEALAAQFCAEFHLESGRPVLASYYLRQARQAYARWGALAIVAHLEARYPALLPDDPAPHAIDVARETSTITTTTVTADLDMHTAVRAARALSSELDPNRVVGRLMELLSENAGAQRGLLLLREGDDRLTVVARLHVEGSRIETGLSESMEQGEVAAAVARYVARTGEPVVTSEANSDARFHDDPYLTSRSVRSLLALPLTHRGRTIGVLYLEHRDVPAAFAPKRVELLSVLAAQAAIAVENALLYRDLEAKVAARTAELMVAKEAADRANQAKSDFLSSMSHELRTPLNSILGYAQILERMPGVPAKANEGVRVMRRSGEHLLTLINDVLDLAKIEAGKMELLPKTIDFPAFIRTVVDMCRVRADAKGLTLLHEIRGPHLRAVQADEKRLMQVLLNLLGNAIKFTPKGRVRLDVDVLEAREGGQRIVQFHVEDQGPGIAPEHLARIFEPFEQVGDAQTRREGTGLGLAITKKIIEQMGGTIEVRSVLGEGTRFIVALELTELSAEGMDRRAPGWEDVIGYQGERRRILVVDDHPDNRAVLREMLVPLGFELAEAEEGAMALQIAAEQKPALVVMDLAMPTMNGYEATSRLRQMPELQHTVIVASSANASKEQQEQSLRAGCHDFLAKPVQTHELLDRLQRHLGLTWVYREQTVPVTGPAAGTESLVVPGAQDLAKLLDAAKAGRIGNLLAEADRVERDQPELGPWLEQVRTLVKGFRLKQVREFLERHVAS